VVRVNIEEQKGVLGLWVRSRDEKFWLRISLRCFSYPKGTAPERAGHRSAVFPAEPAPRGE
jgi:hypothetical protein